MIPIHTLTLINSQTLHTTEKINSLDEKSDFDNQDMDGPFSSMDLINVPSDVKEKIIRLYHENKLIKSKQNDFNEEKLHLVQSQFEDEKQRSKDLQSKLNETSKLKIELECQLNDLKKKSTENDNNIINNSASDLKLIQEKEVIIEELKTKVATLQTKIDQESNHSDSSLKELQVKFDLLTNEAKELKNQKDKELQKKQKELDDSQEKLKSYLEKAKIVIRSLDPSKNSAASETEIQYLKASLAEKDKLIKQLTKENDKMRNSREQEENLMASAWYNQGILMNRRATDERISGIGNSFLSQQRHLPSAFNGSSVLSNSSNSKKHTSRQHNYNIKKASVNDSID